MPKSISINPNQMRATGLLELPRIPINAYQPDAAKEAALYGTPALRRMYRDMVLIRNFETMLDQLKKEGQYAGIAYNHKGPAHLSIGQEAVAVGQAYHLTPDDFTFGSHRSHGEILAKSFSSINQLEEQNLEQIMTSYKIGRAHV